jgi:hypothetical protein
MLFNKYFLLLTFFLISYLTIHAQKEYSFVGVQDCAMCHKTEKQGLQLSIWQNSKHAKAYETLKTEEADAIAKEKGFNTPAVETFDCLKCHASGYDVDASLLGSKFKIEDGVQCETCHGPGSDYKPLSIMKDRQKSIENGLIYHENLEDFCIGCHNIESPTHVPMDFGEAWELIKHPVKKD